MNLQDALDTIERLKLRVKKLNRKNKFLLFLSAFLSVSSFALMWFILDSKMTPESGSFLRFILTILGNSIPVLLIVVCSYILFPEVNEIAAEERLDEIAEVVRKIVQSSTDDIRALIAESSKEVQKNVSRSVRKGGGLSKPHLSSPALSRDAKSLSEAGAE